MRFFDYLTEEIKNDQLKMGIEVEKEHENLYKYFQEFLKKNKLEMPLTLDEFSKIIAEKHLSEKNNYYTLLKKMEK